MGKLAAFAFLTFLLGCEAGVSLDNPAGGSRESMQRGQSGEDDGGGGLEADAAPGADDGGSGAAVDVAPAVVTVTVTGTATSTSTSTGTKTTTGSNTLTSSQTATGTKSYTATGTITGSFKGTSYWTSSKAVTATKTATGTAAWNGTYLGTGSATGTKTFTATLSGTTTVTGTLTITASGLTTKTASKTVTRTAIGTGSKTVTQTYTVVPTATGTNTNTVTTTTTSTATTTATGGTGGAPGSGGITGTGGAGGTGGATGVGGTTGACLAEDCGTSCTKPALPAPGSLPSIADHPDPFLMTSGTRISQKSEWECRRAEIKAQVEKYESGAKPAVSKDNVTTTFSAGKLNITVTEGAKSILFSQTISRPAGAPSGAIPLIIGIGGNSLDASVFSSNGVATTTFANDAMGAQSGLTSRGTGAFYTLYGSTHEASSMIAWAWGVSRIIDAIEKTPSANIDPKRIAVTGCSRNGKGALTAGAFDERIVLTIPQESGAGGSSSWRVAQAGFDLGENVQTLGSASREQPWFRADFGTNFGVSATVPTLPFDQHMVMGMVAPRALFVVDNHIDWLGINASFTSGTIAHEIWKGLGVPDNMGYWQTTEHTHCAFPSSQKAMLDAFVKKFLVGTGTASTAVVEADGGATADLATWMKWATPTLQ